MMRARNRHHEAQKSTARADSRAIASPYFCSARGVPAHHSGEREAEHFLSGCSLNHDLSRDTRHLSWIPFILVKIAFKTGMKGMNGMLRMALRAATPSTPVLIAAHRRLVFVFLSNPRAAL